MPGRKNPMCNTFPRIGDRDADEDYDVHDKDGNGKHFNDDDDDEVNGDAISQNQ